MYAFSRRWHIYSGLLWAYMEVWKNLLHEAIVNFNYRFANKLRNYDNRIYLNETNQHLATENVKKEKRH